MKELMKFRTKRDCQNVGDTDDFQEKLDILRNIQGKREIHEILERPDIRKHWPHIHSNSSAHIRNDINSHIRRNIETHIHSHMRNDIEIVLQSISQFISNSIFNFI